MGKTRVSEGGISPNRTGPARPGSHINSEILIISNAIKFLTEMISHQSGSDAIGHVCTLKCLINIDLRGKVGQFLENE